MTKDRTKDEQSKADKAEEGGREAGTSNPDAEQGTIADQDVTGTAPESHAGPNVDTNADIAQPKK